MRVTVSIHGTSYSLDVEGAAGAWRCRINGREVPVDVAQIGSNRLSILVSGKSYDVIRDSAGTINVGEQRYEVTLTDPRSWRSRQQALTGTSGPQKLTA